MRRKLIAFPSSLEEDTGSPRPVMKLSTNIPNDAGPAGGTFPVTMYLPCPAGIGFSDSASYNDAELGFMGGAILSNIETKQAAGETGGALGAGGLLSNIGAIGTMADRIKAELGGDGKRATAQALLAGDSGVSKAIGIGLGTTMNKNITTEFTGVGTRGFQFQFKFVPSSEAESKTIAAIVTYLRRGVYPTPSAGGIALRYPPKWQIEFLGKIGGGHLTSIPRIGKCFLESIGTTYNGSNAWHQTEDGSDDSAPVETDIQISFKEEKAFTITDILSLERGETGTAGREAEDPTGLPDDNFRSENGVGVGEEIN